MGLGIGMTFRDLERSAEGGLRREGVISTSRRIRRVQYPLSVLSDTVVYSGVPP